MLNEVLERRRSRRGGGAPIALALLCAVAVVVAHALAPFLFGRDTLERELAVQLRATGGLDIVAHHARFSLLPRPRVTAGALHITDPSGTLDVEADGLTGEVRLLPLLVGRVELAGVTLAAPRIALDFRAATAASPLERDSAIGRALAGRAGGSSARRLGSVALANATVRVAREGAPPLTLRGVDVAIDWSDLDAAASLTGSLSLDGERIECAVWLASPAALPRGSATATVLRLHSAGFDLAANGTVATAVVDGRDPRAGRTLDFRGRLTVDAAAPGPLLARVAPAAGLPAAFADAALDTDARIVADATGPLRIDLQKLSFRADDISWEGTLAFRRAPRPIVSATLATDRLPLAPFLARLPAPFGPDRVWSRAALPAPRFGAVDLDMRVSATRLGLGAFAIDDAALSVISRNERLEVALIEGRLGGGTVKGRLSLGRAAAALDLRGTASLVGADASTLSWDAAGRQLATGTMSASLGVESRGDSVAALIGRLAGTARVTLADGEVVDLEAGGGRTAVRSLDISARLADGLATIGDAAMAGPGATMSGQGTLDLRDRTLDVRAMREETGKAASRITVSGPLDALVVKADRGR